MAAGCAAVGAPAPLPAQPVLVGAVGGVASSVQLRERSSDSDARTGFVLGAWTQVQTPAPVLHVLAEVAYARRGGSFPLGGPSGLSVSMDSDWLAMTVAPLLQGRRGPVSAYVYGGPTLELPMRTRTAAELGNPFAKPSDQAFALTAGLGLGFRRGRWSLQGEARRVEALSTAYSFGAGDIRHRSNELLFRVGKERRTEAGAGG